MRWSFLAISILALGSPLPARADHDCIPPEEFVRAFYDDAGLRDRSERPWFRKCVHPDARNIKLWNQMEADAIVARNAGLRIRSITRKENSVRVDLDGVTAAFRVFLTRDGRIGDIFAYQTAATGLAFGDIAARLRELPGRASLVVTREGKEIAAMEADRPLQVSSTMKVGVLKALLDEVKAGRLSLERNALVRPDLKALPSGTLHQFPDNAPVTLHTLASLMMRDSDNTAADTLIDAIGKEKVRALLGLPWLMTYHHWFMLKADPGLYAEFRDQPEERKAGWLAALVPKIPLDYSDSINGTTPQAGWFVSTRRLCSLMDEVAASDFAKLESAYVQYPEWTAVAAKAGGDETSRNDTVALTRLDGTRYCVSVTWNTDEPIFNDERYVFLLVTLIETVRREK
jgi:hypothetical protein